MINCAFRLEVMLKVAGKFEIRHHNFEKFTSALVARDNWMHSSICVGVRMWQCVDDWSKPTGERSDEHRGNPRKVMGVGSWNT